MYLQFKFYLTIFKLLKLDFDIYPKLYWETNVFDFGVLIGNLKF